MFTGMGWTSVALARAISFLKILMVANFDWIYDQNPEQLGKLIVSLIYGLTMGLSVAVDWADLRAGHVWGTFVAHLSQVADPPRKLRLRGKISLILLLTAILSALTAKVYIHIHRSKTEPRQ
jgi:hypothetical protein